jgi:hypothetical protein
MRDLGRYENGDPRLDWAFTELTAHQAAVIQAGRVKVPVGLYNDLQDNDPARTPVFLPQSLYPIRLRDSQVSVDGGKISGFINEGIGNGIEYTLYGGTKNINKNSAFAQSVAERFGGIATNVEVDSIYGAMLHWYTPLDGVGFRLSASHTDNFELTAQTTFGTATQYTDVDILVGSLEWKTAEWTTANEYVYSRNRGTTTSAFLPNFENEYLAGYINTTWHTNDWLELYGAIEYQHSDINGSISDGWAYVAAINILPLRNWSIKAELQLHDGNIGIQAMDNPQGVSSSWQVLALKTTVDF